MKYFTRKIILVLIFLSAFCFSQEKSIRFAWLSDTHVGSTTGKTDLSNSVKDINQTNNIDFVIISGDITQTGKNTDFTKAKNILDSLQKPYYIIPGNHDTKWSESGGTQFIKIWKNDRFAFKADKFLFIGLHQGPLMRMADGHYAPEDIRWLDSLLQTVDKRRPIIFVSHYPLDPSIDNWFEALDLLKKKNTQMILCGHGHSNTTFSFEGIPGIMGRSNLRATEKIGGYNIVELNNDSAFFYEKIPFGEEKSPWYKMRLEEINFSKDSANYQRPDFSGNTKYPNVRIKWSVRENYLVASSFGLLEDKIFIGNSGGEFISYSLGDGKKLWTFNSNGRIFSSPAFSNDYILFGSTDSNLYCLNQDDGKLIWKFKTEGPILNSPVVENNIVYFASSDYKFRAINLTNCKTIWSYTGLNGFVETKPLFTKDKIIFGAWDSYLYALDKTNGKLSWKWNNGNTEELYSPAACEPVEGDGKIFIVAPDRFLSAIDEESGKTLWRTNKHQVRESIGISEDGKTVFARTMNDSVFSFNPSLNFLKVKWIIAAGYNYDFNPASITEKDGKIYFGTRNGLVYCLNSETGKIFWIYKIGVTSVNKILAVNNNNIIVSDMDGKIMSLNF